MTFQDKILTLSEGLKNGFRVYQHESRIDPETSFPLLDVFNSKMNPEKYGWKAVSQIQDTDLPGVKKVKRNVGGKK